MFTKDLETASVGEIIDHIFDRLDQGDLQSDRTGTFFPTAVLERIKQDTPLRKRLPEHEYPSYIR